MPYRRRPTWPSRLVGLVLLALLLGGGAGLPVVDGLLYHAAVHAEPDGPHLEAADRAVCHAENCALNVLPATRSGASAERAERGTASTPAPEAWTVPAAPRSASLRLPRQPRAPPSTA